jgi:hypothetical protein
MLMRALMITLAGAFFLSGCGTATTGTVGARPRTAAAG